MSLTCPRCGRGQDTDGDGNCGVCAHATDRDVMYMRKLDREMPAAQERVYALWETKATLEEQEREINQKVDSLVEEVRSLMTIYPTLHFRRPK